MPSARPTHSKDTGARDANVFSAPGRVNLIGEHTDYNEGFVMPCAIEFRTRVTLTPRADSRLTLHSAEYAGAAQFDLECLPAQRTGTWCDYVVGIAVVLQNGGHKLRGADLAVSSNVPVGAGLSSSAAIEVASALAFLHSNAIALPRVEIAKLCRKAENSFVGAQVGIMDQFVACLGKAGHALLLDCRSLEYQHIPIPDGVRIVVCNTMVKHELAIGEYNRRREDCEQGVKLLSKWYPGIKALRDVSLAQLKKHETDLPVVIYRRCAHVISENERVLTGSKALTAGDLPRFAALMRESHESLRDLYEVSSRELDIMVEAATGLPGFCGGRMTGGGFGGCTVNLVMAGHAEAFAREVAARYQSKTGIAPDVYICEPSDGACAEGCSD